ncbi:hypothetical protein G6F62_011832 [Rhizopus arrhizus]|nr:hypothetical protein G6F23_011573 [Rhizopus arrhizus]KAG1319456.1 hypothetical protein G6F62_011832 [Rhizopus arrhizus]KAG1372976.1 hypothetical protein G6F61_010578 [Rhizopus arrhizus]
MIQLLTKELASARTEIERLRVQTAHLQEQLNQQNATSNNTNPLSPSDFPPLRNTTTTLLQSTPWHQSERLQQIKDQLTAQRQQRRLQRQEAATRLLQPPSTNQGFKYIHLPTKTRVPIGQIRFRLRKLDINNNRIIDIYYPDRNIVALLIHNGYEDELRQQL